ncbi:hypothetical protein QFZ30_001322 [Arthrobacter pascens]|nr:hypothetical protein [Arthrobacter pascens]
MRFLSSPEASRTFLDTLYEIGVVELLVNVLVNGN